MLQYSMNKYLSLNKKTVILLITAFSVLLSYLITCLILFLAPPLDKTIEDIIIYVALLNPLIIAPLATYKIVGLYYKVEKLNKDLDFLNKHDDLTKIYNRKHLLELSKKSLSFFKRKSSSFTVLILDYDFFKKINDTYGHTVGDKVLVMFSQVVSSNIRESDFFGRYGGEEFILVCPDTNIEEAKKIAEKIREIVNEEYLIKKHNITMSVSIGGIVIDTYKTKYKISDLINFADKALYKAKKDGRNRVEVYKKED